MKVFLGAMIALVMIPGAAFGDSLFNRAAVTRGSLITDEIHRYKVGDIITVLVREEVDASTQSNTNTKKESTVDSQADATDNEFLVADKPGGLNIMPAERLPNWKIDAANEHKGSGTTKRANSLAATITCQVAEVMPNGNLRIEGKKKVTVNREDSELCMSGTIRSRDVSPANTISSNQVAGAVIELKGKGPLWNTERRGLITKFLDWFSPF